MIFRTLGLGVLLFSTVCFAQGRKPAVEDFVGIEVDQEQVAPQGTESLFNLQHDIHKFEEKKSAPVVQAPVQKPIEWSMKAVAGIAFALSLPLFIWFIAMNRLKKKASEESASNIEVLEKYRKEREKKLSENIKKAS